MKVKVGNKIYDAENEPVMVILTDMDKYNIACMADDATMYAAAPEDYFSEEEFEEWMYETN
jgi:hypothetical protein